MHPIALAFSMLALAEAAASTRDGIPATSPEPAPLDAAGRAAQAAGWRRWAAEGRDGLGATPTPDHGGTTRRALPNGAGGWA